MNNPQTLTAHGRGETLEDALGEAWISTGVEPDDDTATWVEDWSSGACDITLTYPAPYAEAYAAAESRGLDTGTLVFVATHWGTDTGAWRGVLLEFVRKAWNDPTIHLVPRSGHGSHPYWNLATWEGTATRILSRLVWAHETGALVAWLKAAPSP